jgi:hypothetical protein
VSGEYCGGFSTGYCGEFAAALHGLTGYPIVAYYDSEGRLAHATVAPSKKTRIDEHGTSKAADMLADIKSWNAGRVTQRQITVDELDAESMEGLLPDIVEAAKNKILQNPKKYGITKAI